MRFHLHRRSAPFNLRTWRLYRLCTRSSHHARLWLRALNLRSSLLLRLRPSYLRTNRLRARRVANRRLRLVAYRARILGSLLLGRVSHLLTRDHLLASCFTLRLLLLRLLAHTLALRLRVRCALRALLRYLLLSQLLNLLAGVASAAGCLSRQVGDLSLARLFSRNVRGLGRSL